MNSIDWSMSETTITQLEADKRLNELFYTSGLKSNTVFLSLEDQANKFAEHIFTSTQSVQGTAKEFNLSRDSVTAIATGQGIASIDETLHIFKSFGLQPKYVYLMETKESCQKNQESYHTHFGWAEQSGVS